MAKKQKKAACMHVCVWERARARLTQVTGVCKVIMEMWWWKAFCLNQKVHFEHFILNSGKQEQEVRGQRQPAPALQQARPCINCGWCTSPGAVWNPCSFTKVRSWKVTSEAIWRVATALWMWLSPTFLWQTTSMLYIFSTAIMSVVVRRAGILYETSRVFTGPSLSALLCKMCSLFSFLWLFAELWVLDEP